MYNHLLEHQYNLMKYPVPPKVPLAPMQNGIHTMPGHCGLYFMKFHHVYRYYMFTIGLSSDAFQYAHLLPAVLQIILWN